MNKNYFGEGICSLPGKNSFIRMTWTDDVVDILDSNLRVIESMPMFD
jgi:glutamine cyclotransferase